MLEKGTEDDNSADNLDYFRDENDDDDEANDVNYLPEEEEDDDI